MRGRTATALARCGVLCGGVALALAGADATAADSAPGLRQKAEALRQETAGLADRRRQALLGLYSLETQLAGARDRLSGVRGEAARVRAEAALVHREQGVVRRSLSISQRRLASHLRTLYEQGDGGDPLAVLLGATSLDDAITTLDTLSRTASQGQRVVATTRAARATLVRLHARLAARAGTLAALEAAAARSAAALEQARVQRTAYISTLRSREQLTRNAVASLEQAAQTASAKTEQLAAMAPPAEPDRGSASTADAPAVPTDTAGRSISVTTTGYSLHGATATGIPTGWGVAAVDPSVIPLGTRMTIPGYGEAVAADTGGAVRGATIDLWFPSPAQALAWGRRAVIVTLH